ncbi:MAG: TrkH family potassium uptake protein [Acidobacteria bacterium]|nr:TrkH family potassium uptake protein [Acidobacteriota bacterium]MCB9396323.1 TrkH family potassium uptake protein [Acidobacteriota bacterium]
MKFRVVLSILGAVIFFVGASMLIPMAVGLYFADGSASSLGLSALISMMLGAGLFLTLPRKRRGYDLGLKDGFGIVGFSWFGSALVGALPFMISGAIPEFHHAFFEAASGLTTTGSSILTDIEVVPKGILFWRSFTHWLGGMGIIVLSVAILPYLGLGGMQLYKAESPGPTKDKLRPRIQQTAKLLWGVYILITVACFALLMLAGMDWFDSACHTFGTVATGGFSTYNQSLGYFREPAIHYIVIFFMFLCGISFSLHYRALSGQPSAYTRPAELKFYVFLILACTLIIFWSRSDQHLSNEQNFRESLFQVVSIMTTTGYGTADFETWLPIAQIVLLGLMFVGGCAGSTGGGLKVVRVLLLLRYLKVLLNQQLHPSGVFVIKMDNQIVKREVIQNILGLFMVFVFLHMISSVLLTFWGVDIMTAITATLSCISNIGPGLGDVGPTKNFATIPEPGIWVLSTCMIMGRLEIFSVLILFLPQTWRR